MTRYMTSMSKIKRYCKCGHSVIMPKFVDKQLCDWCNNYVFKDKITEFIYRTKEAKNRIEREV
jgi:ribosomal protein S27AE